MTKLDSMVESRGHYFAKVSIGQGYGFFQVAAWSESWNRRRKQRQRMMLNCGMEKTFESPLGLQGDPERPSWRRSVSVVHWKTDIEAEVFEHLVTSAERSSNWWVRKIEGRRRRWERIWLDNHQLLNKQELSKLRDSKDREALQLQWAEKRVGHDLGTERQ